MNNNLIDKYLDQCDLVDCYITKNINKIIKNKKNFNFIKSNIFLLSVINRNNKNSLIILLESKQYKIIIELIKFNNIILNFKDSTENNFFNSLIACDYFYNYLDYLINNLDIYYVIKLLTDKNISKKNFIDNIILLFNLNKELFIQIDINSLDKDSKNSKKKSFSNIKIKPIVKIIKSIYMLDYEKQTLLVTKLCKTITDYKILLALLEYLNINNFDIYPDIHMLTCIDYLIYNENFIVLKYIIPKINYIEFINIDDNNIFILWELSNIDHEQKIEILFEILKKSNISKLKNSKNQNIFFKILFEYKIDPFILKSNLNLINIYEQDINGLSLIDIIKKKYTNDEIKIILKDSKDIILKKHLPIVNFKNILISSDIGIFNSNIIHNMIYTIYLLNKYNKLSKLSKLTELAIPYYIQSNDYKKNQLNLLEYSNNEKSITGYLKIFLNNFSDCMLYLILWKNKFNYWIDPNLIPWLKANISKSYVFIKLSLYLLDNINSRHANFIFIDNINKIVERFEPYGELIFTNSNDINLMIENNIANVLGYKFKFIQPYPGFQSRSDEYGKYNKSYGDPLGYCLAWSYLYLEIRMELIKINLNKNPIDIINNYIINEFKNDFNISSNNKTNVYILFIRYYSKYLDMEKNKIIKKYNIDQSLIYQEELDLNTYNKIIECINKDLKQLSNN